MTANIYARVIIIEGEAQGELRAEERIVVGKSGNVQGSLAAPRVKLEDGCRLRGSVDLSDSARPRRRKFPRYPVSIPCTVQSAQRRSRGRIVNISRGGALIEHASAPPVAGNTVTLEVQAGSQRIMRLIQINSKVAHSKGSQQFGSFGVVFEESEKDLDLKVTPFLPA